MRFEIALAYWQLELPVDIPAAAEEALAAGQDSPTLRILAGLTNGDRSEVAPLVQSVSRELRASLPTRPQAVLAIARSLAKGIIRGELDPYQGARQISDVSNEAEVGHALDAFIYDASEIDDLLAMPSSMDRDKRIAAFEADIVNAARDLAAS